MLLYGGSIKRLMTARIRSASDRAGSSQISQTFFTRGQTLLMRILEAESSMPSI